MIQMPLPKAPPPPPSDRFEGISDDAIPFLRKIEEYTRHRFERPKLLLEALQFPSSKLRWDADKDCTELQAVGGCVTSLVAAAGEYTIGNLEKPEGMSCFCPRILLLEDRHTKVAPTPRPQSHGKAARLRLAR